MKITTIPLDVKNRMIRIGFGLNDGNWFIRVDMWFVGFILTSKNRNKPLIDDFKDVISENQKILDYIQKVGG